MHTIKKKQLMVETEDEGLTAAEQFYALAAQFPTDRDNCAFMTSWAKFATHPNEVLNP